MIETIRKAEKEDIPAVQKIQQESFGYSYTEAKLLDMLNELFFIAEIDGKAVAYAISNRDGLLVHSATDREFRGKGIGRRMLMNLERELKKLGVKKARCHVRENNPYQTFHESQGYKIKQVIPNFYKNGDGAVFMEKELD